MFTVSKENTVKCLEGSSDIFGNGRTYSTVFGNLRQSSGIFGSLRKSSENGHKFLDTLNKIILAFLEPFLLLSGKTNIVSKNFYC